MAGKFYYAVRKGRVPGIYYSWDDCKAQINGFKGAEYKKFSTIDQANRFIEDEAINKASRNIKIKEGEAISYIDGSYNISTRECGFGVVLFSSKGKESFSEKVKIEKYSDYRNVTGEVFGALYIIKKSIDYGFKKIYINYDYTGISNWALGNWKTNNELTKFYKSEFEKLNEKIDIEFIKVKAHTGDKYNEEADLLAKKSVEI